MIIIMIFFFWPFQNSFDNKLQSHTHTHTHSQTNNQVLMDSTRFYSPPHAEDVRRVTGGASRRTKKKAHSRRKRRVSKAPSGVTRVHTSKAQLQRLFADA